MVYFTNNYYSILTLLGFSLILSCVLVLLPSILSFKINTVEKLSAYECGFEPFSDSHNIFDVHFIVVAILFLLFDFELLLLFPLVISYKSTFSNLGPFPIINLMGFLFLLLIGFIYEWISGALIWPVFLKK